MLFAESGKSQVQKAGAESLQVQASGDIYIGLSEERAREIALMTAKQVFEEYGAEAHSVIQDRIIKLDDRVIAALIRENRLEVFADPGFQRTYRKAQEGAASSERDADYDLLAALLADRATRGQQRTIRAGIEKSIEIIDRVDDEALRGLTVFQAVQAYQPKAGKIDDGLKTMERLLGQLLDGPLPAGGDWLDHLDILDAVRLNNLGELRKFADYWPSAHMPGYLSAGVEATVAPKTFDVEGFPVDWLAAPHELKPGFIRVSAPSKHVLENIYANVKSPSIRQMLADADEIFHLSQVDESCRAPLMDLIRAIPKLREIEEWWDHIAGSVTVTAVGRVLARANAERLDMEDVLPPLN